MIPTGMPPIYIDYLNRLDIEELRMTDAEIIGAIESSLAEQGRGETVIEPRMHLEPGVARGHFNVLRGSIGGRIDSAGVKVVGDFVDVILHVFEEDRRDFYDLEQLWADAPRVAWTPEPRAAATP